MNTTNRSLRRHLRAGTPPPPARGGVVVIGKTLADKLFAGRDPIGRKLAYTALADRRTRSSASSAT